ncbi:MAG TPA: hypothetical protein VFZ61_24650 [Polyangiales bacterium]
MVPAKRTRLKILTAVIAGSVAMGCGSDEKPEGSDGGTGGSMDSSVAEGDESLTLSFSPMYSAFIPNSDRKFRLPVKVEGSTGQLKVATEPADFVDYAATGDGVVTLTMKKAGKTTVRITDGAGNWGKAELTVTEATDSDWETGNERYNNSILPVNVPEGGFQLPEGGIPEGGIPNLDAGGVNFDGGGIRNDNAACASCHVSEGASGMSRMLPDGGTINVDVEHTPQQTGGYSDDELTTIFTQGRKPEGAPFRVLSKLPVVGMLPDFVKSIYMGIHRWNVSASDQKGIITYLRSLEPKSQPEVDFGGLLPPRGSFPRPDGGVRPMDGGTAQPEASTPDAGGTSDAGTNNTDAGVDAGP